MPKNICLECKNIFYAKPSHIKKGWGKYCSAICRNKGNLKGKIVNCSICNKKVYKSPLALKRSKSGKYFCNKQCQTIWRNEKVFIGENHKNWKYGESAYRRILIDSNIDRVCILCKTTDKRVLMIHHYDKNRKNNNLTNLIWLCSNCHYLVHHYKNEFDKLTLLLNK